MHEKKIQDYLLFIGLVWEKLCWGKDMDMKKWKILERPKKTSNHETAINGKIRI